MVNCPANINMQEEYMSFIYYLVMHKLSLILNNKYTSIMNNDTLFFTNEQKSYALHVFAYYKNK